MGRDWITAPAVPLDKQLDGVEQVGNLLLSGNNQNLMSSTPEIISIHGDYTSATTEICVGGEQK